VRGLDQLLRNRAVDAGDADVETGAQEEGAVCVVQIDRGIDRRLARQLDLALGGGEAERAEVAGRPGSSEQVFGGRVRLGQLDVEEAVAGVRGAVGARGDVGLAGEEKLGGGSHGGVLSGSS
jgi:hypothetical protein